MFYTDHSDILSNKVGNQNDKKDSIKNTERKGRSSSKCVNAAALQ